MSDPIACLVIGMAGAGKTTFTQRMLHSLNGDGYVVNLDPAVMHLPYQPNIDIRDSVDFKQVMKDYGLGPNGAILTCMNLFTTKFHQVIDILQQKKEKYVLFDTPGQIEAFTWSASGLIITDALASRYRTVVLFIVDTPRTVNPVTFMSNMTYACSIMFKTRLPFVLVFNKTDEQSCDFATRWMDDLHAFEDALQDEGAYSSCLARSLALVMDEFYRNIKTVGVSSYSGEGIDELLQAIEQAAEEYEREYKPLLEQAKQEKQLMDQSRLEAQIEEMKKKLQSARVGEEDMDEHERKFEDMEVTARHAGNEKEDQRSEENVGLETEDVEYMDSEEEAEDRRLYEELLARSRRV